jgi:hypothetical protein
MNMKWISCQLPSLVLAGLLACVTAPAASIEVAHGDTVDTQFNGYYGDPATIIPGLQGELALTEFQFESVVLEGNVDATRVTFLYNLSDTSAAPVMTSRITSFSFDSTPNILAWAPNEVTGTFDSIRIARQQPSGTGRVDICFTSANCSGVSTDGVLQGQTGAGSISLYFSGMLTNFSLDEIFVHYQSVTCQPDTPCSWSATGTGIPTSQTVPEPGSGWLVTGVVASLAIRKLFSACRLNQ